MPSGVHGRDMGSFEKSVSDYCSLVTQVEVGTSPRSEIDLCAGFRDVLTALGDSPDTQAE